MLVVRSRDTAVAVDRLRAAVRLGMAATVDQLGGSREQVRVKTFPRGAHPGCSAEDGPVGGSGRFGVGQAHHPE